jgi:hypothetical protein
MIYILRITIGEVWKIIWILYVSRLTVSYLLWKGSSENFLSESTRLIGIRGKKGQLLSISSYFIEFTGILSLSGRFMRRIWAIHEAAISDIIHCSVHYSIIDWNVVRLL